MRMPKPAGADATIAALLSFILYGVSETQGATGGGACIPERAQFAVGQIYTQELAERARRAAQARAVRKIEPGAIYTMEFSPNRLNLETDRRHRVRAVRCG